MSAVRLPGERDQAFDPVGVAANAQEAMGENAALQEAAELPLHEPRRRAAGTPGRCQEGLQALRDSGEHGRVTAAPGQGEAP